MSDIGYRRMRFGRNANQIMLNNERVYLLSAFFSTVDYDDTRFLENPKPFNLVEFVKTKKEWFEAEALNKGVIFKHRIGLDTPILSVSVFYQMAISNLIINAIRYAAPGTCVILSSDSDMIQVADAGIPIAETEYDKIFTEGYRSTEAKQVDSHGMGYGLYLTKRILDIYNNEITVSCEKISDRNYYGMNATYRGLKTMEASVADAYIYGDVSEGELTSVRNQYLSLEKSMELVDKQYRYYANEDSDNVKTWLENKMEHEEVFLDMESQVYNKPVYNVIFKIQIYR